MKIALLVNQKPEEAEFNHELFLEWDSRETIAAVKNALEEFHNVTVIDCHPDKLAGVVDSLTKLKPDFCFNMAEGAYSKSREAQVPALLDWLRLPYTGAGVSTLSLTLDKAKTKQILSYHNIPTPDYHVISDNVELEGFIQKQPDFPLIVKPLHEGSSIGIHESSVVTSVQELQKMVRDGLGQHKQPMIVEKFITGREFTVSLIGNGQEVDVLPIVELCFENLPQQSKKIYSYEAKWMWDTPDKPLHMFECPAKLSKTLKLGIEMTAIKAFHAMDCKDWARIDIRLNDLGQPHVLEINALPGILPNPNDNSCFPKSAFSAGFTYNQVINRVLNEAIKRYNCYIYSKESLYQ
jgi:D-alanine-D-alanine ligase